MKKLGLSSLALASVVAFTGCSCLRNGEYTFDSVQVTDGDETKTYTCEKGEERGAAGDLACIAVMAMPSKFVLEGDKVVVELDVLGTTQSQELDAKVEKKKLFVKNPNGDQWQELAEFKGKKLIFGDDDYTIIYKK